MDALAETFLCVSYLFPKPVTYTVFNEPYFLHIPGGKIVGFIPFVNLLAQFKTPAVSSRI